MLVSCSIYLCVIVKSVVCHDERRGNVRYCNWTSRRIVNDIDRRYNTTRHPEPPPLYPRLLGMPALPLTVLVLFLSVYVKTIGGVARGQYALKTGGNGPSHASYILPTSAGRLPSGSTVTISEPYTVKGERLFSILIEKSLEQQQ